jgi:hypothetical protein
MGALSALDDVDMVDPGLAPQAGVERTLGAGLPALESKATLGVASGKCDEASLHLTRSGEPGY